jgi:hypothetical protein
MGTHGGVTATGSGEIRCHGGLIGINNFTDKPVDEVLKYTDFSALFPIWTEYI